VLAAHVRHVARLAGRQHNDDNEHRGENVMSAPETIFIAARPSRFWSQR
jgi:hypothetical protein